MSADENGFINSNIIGGLNLLNSCIKKKIKRVILISSINVYGENLERPSKETDRLCPKTTYAGVKMITEQMYKAFAENHGINITILRVAGIFGPGNKRGFLTKIIQSIKNKNITPVCYNNGEQQRDILYIDDVVDCILNVVNSQHDGFHVFNISSGKRHSINELISMIEKISKTKISAKYSSEIPDEKCIWADNTKAKKFLKFNPKVGIEAGLEYAVNQFLN
jgi:nucleoside-diphosphate-sugar epimerase